MTNSDFETSRSEADDVATNKISFVKNVGESILESPPYLRGAVACISAIWIEGQVTFCTPYPNPIDAVQRRRQVQVSNED